MSPAEFVTEMIERTDRSEMLLAALYAAAERCGTQREAFYSLRKINDAGYAVMPSLGPVADPGEVLDRIDEINDLIAVEIERIDTDPR